MSQSVTSINVTITESELGRLHDAEVIQVGKYEYFRKDKVTDMVAKFASQQTASLQKQVELLKVRAEKLAEREQRTGAENAGLLARIEQLQAENEQLKAKAMEDYRVVIADEVGWHNDRIKSLESEVERLKKQQGIVAKDFFYWWFNTPGTNTEQGYESYLKTDRYKALNPQYNQKEK